MYEDQTCDRCSGDSFGPETWLLDFFAMVTLQRLLLSPPMRVRLKDLNSKHQLSRTSSYIYNNIPFKFQYLFLIKSHLQSYPCPNNINTFWNIGFLLGISIVLQLITGILLSLHYTPHINYSYYSIMYINVLYYTVL